MTKFYEEFIKVSKGKFPMLKLNSATYHKEKRELVVRFIISTFEIREFNEQSQNEVQSILNEMFSGVKVSIQYIRTYADNNVVKNKIMEFFNRYNQMIFRRIKEDTLEIEISDSDIEIKMTFETPIYKMIVTGEIANQLKDYLDKWFNQNIEIELKEKVVDFQEVIKEEDLRIDTVVVRDTSLRLINVDVGDKIYSRGKIAGINQLPNYIADVKGATDNIILCGKVSNISKRMYKNKRYKEDDPKTGQPELPLIRFILDDTTAKIECVCFPRPADVEKIESMEEHSQIVCTGKVSISTYNNALSYAINGIFEADIDFESIQLTTIKPVPERYETIFPEVYKAVTQKSMFDIEDDVPSFLKDKTFVVFDLEATDKFPESAEIIEIAACKVVNGKPVETFQTLTKPSALIPDNIIEITSIDNDMVKSSPIFESVMPDFYKFTRDCALVGHNISGYDYPLIAKYAKKEGYNFDNDLVDTLLLSRKHLPELKAYRLEQLSKHFNIAHENAHRAMSDVLATVELLLILAKKM